jgi:outer membrane protein assembly factor BamB
MSRQFLVAGVLAVLAASSAQAQIPFSHDLMPTQAVTLDGKPLTPLARIGLERHWFAVIPLYAQERMLLVNLAEDLLFAQTSQSNLHAYDAETGRFLWTTNLGAMTAEALPVSVNADSVFVTGGANNLFVLDRKSGRIRWNQKLESMPSSSTAADDERVSVGLNTGKLATFLLKDHTSSFNWQTGGELTARPILAGPIVAFASHDARAYVALKDPPKLIFRYRTGGPITADMGTYGTRTLLISSEDNTFYAVDLFTGETKWSYPTSSPVNQQPLVAKNEVYVINNRGGLFCFDAETGKARWTLETGGGRLLAVTETRVFLETGFRDLFIVDRQTGAMAFDARAVRERAGLDVRQFNLTPTNPLTGRIYLASSSGMIVCLRELGRLKPYLLRDPNAKPFGYVPKQGEPDAPGPAGNVPGPAQDQPDAKPPAEEKPDTPPEAGDAPK